MRNNKGFVWLIVLLVIAVVVGIIWTKRSNSVGENATSTTETVTSVVEDVPKAATPATTPTPVTKSPTPAPASKPSMTASGAYIVYYTSKGFSPSTITISRGSSVHFANSAQAAMLITPVDAVNNPYASFRQSKSVGNGGVFDYTFTSPGSYSYYNANNKSHVGIITVR